VPGEPRRAGREPGGMVGRSVTVTATITGIDKALKTDLDWPGR
jgi:hypothetical protein